LSGAKLLPSIGDEGAADAGGEFGTQGQALAAPILERIDFLRDDVGAFADRADEHLVASNTGISTRWKAVEPAHAIERRHDRVETLGRLADNVLSTPDRLYFAAHRRGLSIFA
jgi:hypothetical protein